MTLIAADAPVVLTVAVTVLLVAGAAALAYFGTRFWLRHGGSTSEAVAVPEGLTIDEPPADKHVRSPSDVLHLVVGILLVLLGLLLATGVSNTLVGFERDMIDAFGALPGGMARALSIAFIVVAILIPIGVGAVVIWYRRWRLLGLLAGAGLLGQFILALLDEVVKRTGQPALTGAVSQPDWARGIGSIDSAWIAGMAATIVAASPWVSRRWRRAGWAFVVVAVVFRTAAGDRAPTDVVLALGAGVLAGAAVLLIFGAPNKRPRGVAVAAAMEQAGVPLASLTRAGVDARSSTPYFAETRDGRSLFVKVLGTDERSADLLFRLYRFLRVKHVGDRGPFTSLQRMVEHEALVALYASDMDIRTPRLVVTAGIGDDGFLLAYERITGASLDHVDDDAVDDGVLGRIWQVVHHLRTHRIAHRDLRLANVLLAPNGEPWMIDFGFAEIAATDEMLDTDVAELLSSTALKAGIARAVDAAIAEIGKPAVARAAPRIQPLALSTATRKSLQARKPLCDELRKYAAQASDAGDVEPQNLQRIKPRTVLLFVSLAVAFYLLIPQLADVSGVWSKLKEANWTWALWALGASALTYVAAAIGLTGAVSSRIRFSSTLSTQLAGSFVNRIIPARVGGIATNVRFLQKQGLELAAASSSVGLQQIAGLIMHVSLSFAFLVWAGQSGAGAFDFLPSGQTVLIGLTIILALSGLLFLLPAGRRVVRKRVLPVVSRSGQGIGAVARRPLKVAELFGGAALLTLAYIAALVFCVHAFGGDTSVASVGVVFLVGSAVSSAAPTPGGIGAVEAALIAGLTAMGLDRDIAVPAVFLYRIATFWLPIVPGWASFALLQRRGEL